MIFTIRGDGRAADCDGLENRSSFGDRGFESYSPRKARRDG